MPELLRHLKISNVPRMLRRTKHSLSSVLPTTPPTRNTSYCTKYSVTFARETTYLKYKDKRAKLIAVAVDSTAEGAEGTACLTIVAFLAA